MKLKYMDEPWENYDEWFCKTDDARNALVQAGIIRPGDRCVMKNGDIYMCWNKQDGFEKMISGGSSQQIVFDFKGTVPTYNDLPPNAEFGDMYLIEDTDQVYFWNGNDWQEITLPEAIYTFSYKGTVASSSGLPQVNNNNGDIYQLENTTIIYIWSGVEWVEEDLEAPLYVLTYKGVVSSVASLPVSGNQGDIYQIDGTSKIEIWNGESWQEIVLISYTSFTQAEEKFANFYDYQGYRVYSYTKNEIQNLSSLPQVPAREGCANEGWNWTLEQLKLAESEVNVGAIYHCDASEYNTSMEINIPNENMLNFTLYFNIESGKSVMVDWGIQGISPVEYVATQNGYLEASSDGIYSEPGTYRVKVYPKSQEDVLTIGSITKSNKRYGLMGVYNNMELQAYRNMVKSIHIGKGAILGNYGLANFYHLEYITFNSDHLEIGQYACQDCIFLTSVILPSSSAGVEIGESAFYNCHALNILSLPYNIKSIGLNAFYSCYALNVFNYYNPFLENINIANSFVKNARGLKAQINMGENVTVIANQAFQDCSSVEKIKYFGNLQGSTVGQNAFSTCYSLYIYDFRYCTSPPALPGITSTYIYLTENTKIYISDEYKQNWLSASNWANLDEYYVYV